MSVIYWRELLLVCIVCIYVCMVSHNTLELVATLCNKGLDLNTQYRPSCWYDLKYSYFAFWYAIHILLQTHKPHYYVIYIYISTFVKTQLKVRHLTTMFTRYIYTTMLPLKKWKYPYWHYSLCVAAVGKRSAYDIGF